jgi:CPA2 family monovalent cation:H+ antiporter-2
MQFALLQDVVIIIGLSVAAVYIFRKIQLPGIVGYLITGAVAGPHGIALIGAREDVEVLAEIGVVVLLFTIGLEFSLNQLWRIREQVLLGGTFQVFATGGLATLIATQFGVPLGEAIVIGCLVALSSTAVVLGLLQHRGEINTPQGRMSLAILIYQDIIVIGMLLLVPLLAGDGSGVGMTVLWLLLKTVIVGTAVVVLARYVVPVVLERITATGENQLFVLSIVFMTLGIAWGTALLGLSLALGAFLAGLIVSESEHSHRALGSIMPFRDVFTSFFFVSVGMMLNVGYVAGAVPLVLGTTLGVIVLKSLLVCAIVLLLRYPLRIAVMTGLILAQVGEFSFLVFQVAVQEELLSEMIRQLFLAVSVVTMMLTPALIAVSKRAGEAAAEAGWLQFLRREDTLPTTEDAEEVEDHLIIAGFGFTGQNVARAARASDIEYLIVELSPATVQRYSQEGEPIFCGDATYAPVLEHAGIERAGVLVVAMSDAAATRRTIQEATRLNPACHVIVRSQFASELRDLIDLGANEVVSQEFEASVEMFARVLRAYMVAPDRVEELVMALRADSYALLSAEDATEHALGGEGRLQVWHHDVSAVPVCEGSPLAGKTPAQIKLRAEHGVTLIAVQREGNAYPNPPADFRIEAGDIAVVMGDRSTLSEFAAACRID